MAISTITAFWAVSVLLILVPGADWAYAITAGLRGGSVVPAVSGLVLGYVALTAVVAGGVAAAVASSPGVLTALTMTGAAYLIWLGASALARPGTPGEATDASGVSEVSQGATGGASRAAGILKGAAISGLNPKALLLFLAILPQFTTPTAGWPLAAQLGALGMVHTLSCAVVYLGVGVLARTVLSTRPAAARAVTRASGAAMILIGAFLMAERLAA
ncbi:LysE family translocator [Streptomyces sp. NPDC021622]|uniref:LysE family translocator n=1 Tax=Streptomyces sp. NPDC021622 TaxID=3155013 RepID=UPI0033E59714